MQERCQDDLIFYSLQSSDSDDGKGGIASFLPKDQVWKWADKGQKRSKGRVYHRVIERKDEKLGIGDSAVFLSTNCPDQPYIGRLESMWETASGTKNVGVRWYYHLAEVDCSQVADKQKLEKIKQPKVIFPAFLLSALLASAESELKVKRGCILLLLQLRVN